MGALRWWKERASLGHGEPLLEGEPVLARSISRRNRAAHVNVTPGAM
jgi:hypothetical protein